MFERLQEQGGGGEAEIARECAGVFVFDEASREPAVRMHIGSTRPVARCGGAVRRNPVGRIGVERLDQRIPMQDSQPASDAPVHEQGAADCLSEAGILACSHDVEAVLGEHRLRPSRDGKILRHRNDTIGRQVVDARDLLFEESSVFER